MISRGRKGSARRNEWSVSALCYLGGTVPSRRPGPNTGTLIHETPASFLQNWPESHPAEHTQIPGAAFLGLVEALQQGRSRGASLLLPGGLGGGASRGWEATGSCRDSPKMRRRTLASFQTGANSSLRDNHSVSSRLISSLKITSP